PTLDGIASAGEWTGWELATGFLVSDPDLFDPSTTLTVSLAAKNTANYLYLGIQVPEQILANESISSTPPYEHHFFGIEIRDGYTRTLDSSNYLDVYYEVRVDSINDVTDRANLEGVYRFADTDPSHPYTSVGFENTSGARGTYTFEICFPFATLPPLELPSEGGYRYGTNLGLRPAAQYRVISMGWVVEGNAYDYSYMFFVPIPPDYMDADNCYIVSAFDPMPLIILVSELIVVIVVITVLVILYRRRRQS
ncbi:MAG: hypothetical protein ACFFCO_09885, partial [Promethearchaeota archaeon]